MENSLSCLMWEVTGYAEMLLLSTSLVLMGSSPRSAGAGTGTCAVGQAPARAGRGGRRLQELLPGGAGKLELKLSYDAPSLKSQLLVLNVATPNLD